jgi:hypothetical protein
LQEVKALTLLRQKAYRWRQGCQPYAPAARYPQVSLFLKIPGTRFNIPYVYDFITKLCRQQAVVILNHDNEIVRNIGQGEARHSKYKRLKLGGGQAYDRSSV